MLKIMWKQEKKKITSKSAVPGLFANPVVGAGASVIMPDAARPDAAAVFLVLVFVLLPRVEVAGERRRKSSRKGKIIKY